MKAFVLDYYDGPTTFLTIGEDRRVRLWFWHYDETGDGDYPRHYVADQSYHEVKSGAEFLIVSEEDLEFIYDWENLYE